MYDAALFYAKKAEKQSRILAKYHYKKNQYMLATIHRAENTDNQNTLLTNIFCLERLSKTLPIIMPLHPRTRKRSHSNFQLY